ESLRIGEKGDKMKNKRRSNKDEITSVHLHLELKGEYLTEYHKRMLKRYGESSTGEAICRDILIPSDMPLHNLHYTIQKLYGWQNSHLRSFHLPEEVYQKLTGGTVKGWSDLVGILFQPPSESEEDIFWDDDYEKGSISAWLKKKYIGPYFYGGELEHPEAAKRDVQQLMDSGTENLLERLEVSKILAGKDELLDEERLFPIAKEIIYTYDFGDNWTIIITKEDNCRDLLENGLVSHEEIVYANDIVLNKYMPVCIHRDGVFLLDDVGGLSGFADFLGTVYESDDKEESDEHRTWAKGLGWSEKKIANKRIL
uniref:IS1096 element passenger TnpR family protein n=1 Tax=Macellibacteroides fermentans TaxID=879969 RepID=UPI00406D458A